MKIPLLPLLSAFGVGLFATSCNHYDYHGHHSTRTVTHYRTGSQVRALPPRYRTLNYGGTRYFYHNNVYYRPQGSGYVVVADPRGRGVTARTSIRRTPDSRVMRTLPRGHRVVTHRGARYYRHGDSFYQPTRGGYRMVDNPYGRGRRGWR